MHHVTKQGSVLGGLDHPSLWLWEKVRPWRVGSPAAPRGPSVAAHLRTRPLSKGQETMSPA